jgi:hypothetical protein
VSTVVFYLSGHGFGHAARQMAVIQALQARAPDVRIVVRTSVPLWFFAPSLTGNVGLMSAETDTGVLQVDSLTVDPVRSITLAAAFHADLDRRSDVEAAVLAEQHATLVVSDIPALAFTAATRAGVPAVAVANFTWDWIYQGYGDAIGDAPHLIPTLQRAYASAACAWRLPMHGGFEAFARVIDAPLVARRPSLAPGDVRTRLGLPEFRPLALIAFGRYGLERIDWTTLSLLQGYGLVTTTPPDTHLAAGSAALSHPPFLPIDERAMVAEGVRFEDLLGAMDVVVTKPGYGMVAECAAGGTAMLYTSRGPFVEHERLVETMSRFIRARHIAQHDLFRGRWTSHLDALLAQPHPPAPDLTGADVVADGLLGLM